MMENDYYKIREQFENLGDKLKWFADEMDKRQDQIMRILKNLEDRVNGDGETDL